jgi:threonylcarbamoyladenosine tRNA methylthiotransferase MtaB
MLFDRAIARLASESSVIAHHFHIPLQSGSDTVLRRMRRPYKASRFYDLILFIHEKIPDAGLGTDVLVGFPGETDRDFDETCELVRMSPLSYLHVFPYSPREGTEAFTLPDRVSPDVVKKRLKCLLEISQAKSLSFRQRFLGQTLPAITLSKEEVPGSSNVLTGNFIHAKVQAHSIPPNSLVMVRIEDVEKGGIQAKIVL